MKNKTRKQNENQIAHHVNNVKKIFFCLFCIKYTLSDMGWQRILLVNRRRQQYLAPIIVVKLTEEMGRHSLNKQLKPTFHSH